MEAEKLLQQTSTANRHLYHKRLVDAVEAQQEMQQSTSYQEYDAETGLARLRESDGSISYGKAQTNGATGKGESVRLRGNKYDNMPHRKPEPIVPTIPPKFTGGMICFLDTNWLNINPLSNAPVFAAIVDYCVKNQKIYTMNPDSRISTASFGYAGLLPTPGETGVLIPNLVLDQKNIEIIGIDLSQFSEVNQVNSAFFVPLIWTDQRITNQEFKGLKKIAKNNFLIVCGELRSVNTRIETEEFLIEALLKSSRIKIEEEVEIDFNNESYYTATQNNKLAKSMPSTPAYAPGTANFSGLYQREIVMTNTSGLPGMALIEGSFLQT
ncbi:hypothetical protein [Nostoc sp. FACHB-110]|uniref:hypothetical protein n=1 Tax=Nostoc sp. FACHB-110 TaxID=2692834 RepID=UPI00168494F3|nr:hypothetical protein [Nostoc sp. FACHB-110]MBD2437370.1 hypothetical protein [Nostoc sp. FACHB-110]